MPYIPNDPLYAQQWHFTSIGLRGAVRGIEVIWDDYTGAGVTVATYEPVNTSHPDLIGQFVSPPPADTPDSGHGTPVAGLIAAADNEIGGIGVAFDARLASFGPEQNYDVVSASWGWGGVYPYTYQPFGYLNGIAGGQFETMVEEGRGGLGTNMAKAAGNFNTVSTTEILDSHRYSSSIAAISQNGFLAGYSSYGSAILVGAPDAAVSTDPVGVPGQPGDYTFVFNGTSAATPVVSGVIALMLDANPHLGWRDVQDILALSATRTGSNYGAGPANGEQYTWGFNPAKTWNGGGYHISSDYGYGAVNVFNAVRLAEAAAYIGQAAQTSGNEQVVSSATVTNTQTIAGTVNIPIAIATADIEIDHVAVTMNVTEADFRNLTMTLISPTGTQILLHDGLTGGLSDGIAGDTSDDALTRFINAAAGPQGLTWTWGVEGLRGETAAGNWTLRVTDTSATNRNVQTVKLDIYGSYASPDDVYTYTDEFAAVQALQNSRSVLNDAVGDNWFNGATLTGNLQLNMNPEAITRLNGAVLISAAKDNRLIGAIGTDFQDHMIGNELNNRIFGMRDDDSIYGRGGNDLINGGKGGDILDGREGVDTVDYAGSAAAVYIDLSAPIIANRARGGDAEGDFLVANVPSGDNTFENVNGSDHEDKLAGDYRANVLSGAGGDDILNGLDGSDTVTGGQDGDGLIGGAGLDLVFGGAGNDTIFGDQVFFRDTNGHLTAFEITDNVTQQRALNLRGMFALADDSNVTDSATIPHVSVDGYGSGDVQYYSFFAFAGSTGVFDIDATSAAFDSWIKLYDATGAEIAQNDDAAGDPGSTDGTDSLLAFSFTSNQLYTLAVGQYSFANFVPIADGESYTLHLSLTNPSTTVQGASDVLYGGAGNDEMFGGTGDDVMFGDSDLSRLPNGDVQRLAGMANTSIDRAQSLDGLWSLADNGNIRDSTSKNHVTIQGKGDGSVHFFAFTVTKAGTGDSYFDIDGGAFDTSLRLYNSDGVVVAENDNAASTDPGSAAGSGDAGFSYNFAAAGTFYIAVSQKTADNRFAATANGLDYSLHISLDSPRLVTADGRDVLLGEDGADTLYGGGGNDKLDGGKSADQMVGEGGNDLYVVDDALDSVVESKGQGKDRVETTLDRYTLDSNVESLVYAGLGSFTGMGNARSNQIFGGGGNDTFIMEGGGNDQLRGGGGTDTADFRTLGGVVIDLLTGVHGGSVAGDKFVSIERMFGSLSGADDVTAGLRKLIVFGFGGNDALRGGERADKLLGGTGADTLFGNGGNDTLSGNEGNDEMTGGAGADAFLFSETVAKGGFGFDRIADFEDGIDTLKFSTKVATSLDDFTITSGNESNTQVFVALNALPGTTIMLISDNAIAITEADVVFF